MRLKRIYLNRRNTYWNEIIEIKDYRISVQANRSLDCNPRENYENPNLYKSYYITIMHKTKYMVPYAYMKYFTEQGEGKRVEKEIMLKILKYIESPIGIMVYAS